jgi:hypothetical protein
MEEKGILTLSIASLDERKACFLESRITDLKTTLPGVSYNTEVPLSVWWGLTSTSVMDRWWSLQAAKPVTRARWIAVHGACRIGRRLLPIIEGHPTEQYKSALSATEFWIDNPSEKNNIIAEKAWKEVITRVPVRMFCSPPSRREKEAFEVEFSIFNLLFFRLDGIFAISSSVANRALMLLDIWEEGGNQKADLDQLLTQCKEIEIE